MALGLAEATKIPFRFGLVRSHYAGRSFITPEQIARELGVRMKLNADRAWVKGKRVAVVDDSLVRGTTSKKVVALLRDAGATEVHMYIASPPVRHPCFWGIDTPSYEELAAANLSIPELATMVNADSLTYITLEDLRGALGDPSGNEFCVSCFNGEPPVPDQIVPGRR